MRQFFLVLLLAAFAFASSNALACTPDCEKTKLLPNTQTGIATADQSEVTTKRSLRVHDTTTEDDTDEERRIVWLAKLKGALKTKDAAKLEKLAKKKQYRQWLTNGEDPKTIYALLGFTGKGPAARRDPRYTEWLEFSALWRRKKGTLAKEWWQIWRKNAW